ncbi:MAG: DUF2958 domain-containing protein [Patescibacteria group bacterium]
MLNPPTKDQLNQIPQLRETESIPDEEKMIYLHFFHGNCHWFIAEFDGENTFFGCAVSDDGSGKPNWRDIDFSDLKLICVDSLQVSCEPGWVVKKVSDIDIIRRSILL